MKITQLASLLFFVTAFSIAQQQHLQDTTKFPFIEILDNNEQFTLQYASSGCFHQAKEMLTFIKENDTYYVIFQQKQTKLTASQLKAISRFENELALPRNGSCTTVDTYQLVYNDSKRMVTDGSCVWNGYQKLKKALGLISK